MQSLSTRFNFTHHFYNASYWLRLTAKCLGLVLCTLAAHTQEVKMYSGLNVVLSGNVNVVFNNTAFKNNGTFIAGASTVSFVGNTDTAVSSISGTSSTTFNNLTLNKTAYGIAIKSWVGVKNILTVSAGKLYANSSLTLLSDSDNTARLAAVPSGAYIYGNAMVERYIPSKRAWRMMTAPVTSSATIYNSWQNGGVYTVGRGLLVSGTGGGNGLDNGNTYSLKKFNIATQSFTPVTNTNVSMSGATGSADNIGYFVFIRGDRNPILFNIPNTNNTTITSIGILQTGMQTFTASSTSGAYTMIGNPYAAPIDFNNVTRTNLLKRFYVWDPKLNVYGAYVTMDDLNNDGVYTKSSSASSQTQEIQSSQAFFVQTTSSGAASLTISESSKSVTNNTNIFRPATSSTIKRKIGSIRTNIYLLNTDNEWIFADGALAEFAAGFDPNFTMEDATKLTNVNETIGFNRENTTLSIERRPVIKGADTLFIKLQKTTQRNYQLQLVPENLKLSGLSAYLEDSYLKTRTPIGLSSTATISFAVDANAESASADRFRIVFKNANNSPVLSDDINAYTILDKVQVDWQAPGDSGIVKYELEKSGNGVAFDLINSAAVNATGRYSWVDQSPFDGKNFYRVKTTDSSGEVRYSAIAKTLMESKISHFSIQPNPVKGSIIHVQFSKQPQGNYLFTLINSGGQPVFSEQSKISNTAISKDLNTKLALPAGLYQLQITGPDNKTETQKIIIQQ